MCAARDLRTGHSTVGTRDFQGRAVNNGTACQHLQHTQAVVDFVIGAQHIGRDTGSVLDRQASGRNIHVTDVNPSVFLDDNREVGHGARADVDVGLGAQQGGYQRVTRDFGKIHREFKGLRNRHRFNHLAVGCAALGHHFFEFHLGGDYKFGRFQRAGKVLKGTDSRVVPGNVQVTSAQKSACSSHEYLQKS